MRANRLMAMLNETAFGGALLRRGVKGLVLVLALAAGSLILGVNPASALANNTAVAVASVTTASATAHNADVGIAACSRLPRSMSASGTSSGKFRSSVICGPQLNGSRYKRGLGLTSSSHTRVRLTYPNLVAEANTCRSDVRSQPGHDLHQ
jgi:hypothetical protein